MTTRLLLSLVLLLGGLLAFLGGDGAAQPQPAAVILDIKGGIGPATTDYVRRGLGNALARRPQAKKKALERAPPVISMRS